MFNACALCVHICWAFSIRHIKVLHIDERKYAFTAIAVHRRNYSDELRPVASGWRQLFILIQPEMLHQAQKTPEEPSDLASQAQPLCVTATAQINWITCYQKLFNSKNPVPETKERLLFCFVPIVTGKLHFLRMASSWNRGRNICLRIERPAFLAHLWN